jgi:hypothetical protein
VFWQETVEIVGLVSGVAGIVGFLLPASGWKSRAVHAVWVVLIALAAGFAGYYQRRLSRVEDVARSATTMVCEREMHYTQAGFTEATLAFLERNRDLYPDTYARAVTLANKTECSSSNKECSGSIQHGTDVIDLSFAMQGLLRGISTLSGGSSDCASHGG